MCPKTVVLQEACEHAIQIASLCISFSCSKQQTRYAEHPSCVTKISLARSGKHVIMVSFLRCWPWLGMDEQSERKSVHLLHFTHLLNREQICFPSIGKTGLTHSHLCHSWLQSIGNWPNPLISLPQLVAEHRQLASPTHISATVDYITFTASLSFRSFPELTVNSYSSVCVTFWGYGKPAVGQMQCMVVW